MNLSGAFELAEDALAAADAAACARAFGRALKRQGASFFQARRYRRPQRRLTAQAHWDAGGVLHRIDERNWLGRQSSNYICFDCNPLLEPVAKSVTRFRFSDFAPRTRREYGRYWDAMGEGGIGDALGAMAFGREDAIAALHIGFEDPRHEPERDQTISAAASLVVERLLQFEDLPASEAPAALTTRERDVLGFLSEGKTDWEISRILGIGETTARFHVDNARRKLGASNRAQAVARYIAAHGFR